MAADNTKTVAARGTGMLPKLQLADVSARGAYVMQRTGLLVRVPPDAVAAGLSALIKTVGRAPIWASQLSDDCWIRISKARQLAAVRICTSRSDSRTVRCARLSSSSSLSASSRPRAGGS
jgi:hypothetical protein